MGIPYAAAPVGDLRFKDPQPPGKWSGVRDASVEGSVCLQYNGLEYTIEGDEDCLFLNVYTPKLPNGRNDIPKAVMVWIHGGAYYFGSGDRDWYGPDFLITEDVVVVTINYRLGAFGFLSLQNKEIPGNFGMKDQVMALRWVQQNIAKFGGDPGKVTIFGESAGGASVFYHMISPMSKGLFQRAISQSGSPLNVWGFFTPDRIMKSAISYLQELGIDPSDPKKVVQELRKLSSSRLMEAQLGLLSEWGDLDLKMPFRPTTDIMAVDNQIFLPDLPINLLNDGKAQKIPYISGATSYEAIIFSKGIKQSVKSNTEIDDYVAALLGGQGCDVNKGICTAIDKVKEAYFSNAQTSNETVFGYINMVTDIVMVHGIYCTVQKQASLTTTPIYMYELSFTGSMSSKRWFGGPEMPGASHADDLAYLFRRTISNRRFVPGSPELMTSMRMVKLWTNFAKTGNPTPEMDPLLENVVWKPVTESDLVYLDINSELTMQHNFKKERMLFWEELYQNYSAISSCWVHH
ncbi:esterase FE4-like [Periplaneta americana]|uniref:esterase FE4-like n=1 Tax=Periplaneta americana TaxID=6978 RepID=UPI0037E935A2